MDEVQEIGIKIAFERQHSTSMTIAISNPMPDLAQLAAAAEFIRHISDFFHKAKIDDMFNSQIVRAVPVPPPTRRQ